MTVWAIPSIPVELVAVRACVRACVYAYVCVRACMHACVYAHVCVRACVRVCACVRACVRVHARVHACVRAHRISSSQFRRRCAVPTLVTCGNDGSICVIDLKTLSITHTLHHTNKVFVVRARRGPCALPARRVVRRVRRVARAMHGHRVYGARHSMRCLPRCIGPCPGEPNRLARHGFAPSRAACASCAAAAASRRSSVAAPFPSRRGAARWPYV